MYFDEFESVSLDYPNSPSIIGEFLGHFIAKDWMQFEYLEKIEKIKSKRNHSIKMLLSIFNRISVKTTIQHARKLFLSLNLDIKSYIVGDFELEDFMKSNNKDRLISIFIEKGN